MHTYKLNRLPKKTTEIVLSIPKDDIKNEYKKAFSKLSSELTVEGFRKGKAPAAIAEKNISKDAIYQELLKTLLSRIYEEIVKKENMVPVMNPKIDLVKAKENEDWEIKITVAEKPEITLGDYRVTIKKVKENKKKDEIWVPGKDKQEKKPEEDKQKQLNEILGALLKEAKIDISDLILEEELNQRLAKLVDDVQKIGLTTEAYLKSKNLTIDDLKKRYKQEIEDTYKLEYLLSSIADKEGVKVEKEELDKLFTNIKDEKEKAAAVQNAYFYASILRKQKTLDLLLSL
jgi:FKBP-type peptidyl-prolyl cis-trans isomerase (trigger factor)